MSAALGVTVFRAQPLSIPWLAVQAWCDRARLAEEDREFVAALVAAMDREYLAWWQQANARPGGQGNSLADKVARWERAQEG